MSKINHGFQASVKIFRKYSFSLIMGCLLAIFIFNPNAKPWILERFVLLGLFKAKINKQEDTKNKLSVANLSFTDSAGKTTSITSLKGKVVFINFWASWCPPCRAEMPSIYNLYLKFNKDNRMAFVFLNEDDDGAKALSFIHKNNFRIPLTKTIGNIPLEIFSGTLPTTIVLNKEGKIVYKREGMAGYDTEEFISGLKNLF